MISQQTLRPTAHHDPYRPVAGTAGDGFGVRILGPLQVVNGASTHRPRGPKVRKVLALLAVLTYLWNGAADGYWWEVLGTWARAVCWVLLVTVLLQVRAALKRRAGHSWPTRYPSQWR